MNPAEAAERVLDALHRGEPIAEIVRLDDGGMATARMLVTMTSTAGTLGDPGLDDRAREVARGALRFGGPGIEEIGWNGTTVRLYVHPHRPEPALVIVGAGHIAQPLCSVGALLGFRVTVLDDRPEFATAERFPEAAEVRPIDLTDPFAGNRLGANAYLVLVTRGHRYDYEVLERVLREDPQPAYIGMVGSRRRVRAAFEQLARAGIPTGRLESVHAPIGLDIEAETPEEIAVAIAAELVQVRRGGSGIPLRERERVVARWVRPIS